jgi:ubiquinone/menaquinone biosynthesis C-methylase UbiE
MMKAIARNVLPAGLQGVLSRLLAGSSQFSISFEIIPQWPSSKDLISWVAPSVNARYKEELLTFKLEDALQSPVVRDNLEVLSKIELEKPVLLDFGCGQGSYRTLLSSYPKTKEWDYVGAEVNPYLVELCRAAYPDTRFEVVNTNLPFRDGEFDVTLASGTVQYIED